MSLRFADLNPLGRAIIIVVAALTFGVAAISFATSYGALYAYARDTGLYSERLTRLWPLLLDGAFIVAQLAAILAGILRGSRGWPILTMLLTGALTVWFNLQHAGADPGRRLAAALPPVLMMLAFEIDIQIVKWVMTALGKPLGPIAPPPTDGMLPGAVWRSDGLDWNVPPSSLPGGWPPGTYGRSRQATTFRKTHRTGKPDCRPGTGRDPAGVTKRQRIEEYLDRLSSEQLQNLTVRELTGELAKPGPGGHRALRQADPRPAATRTQVPAAGEWPPQPAPMTGTEPRPQAARGRLRPVPDPDRQPPHNLEAEEAVLGAILAAGRLLAEVAAVLEEADFYRPAHRAIWRAILRLADRGQPTDPVTVLGELDHSRRAGRRRRRPVPPHPRPGRPHRGQCRPLRPAGRRGRPAPAGDRPRASAWPTPTPTQPCSPTSPASWPTPGPPHPASAAGSRPSRSAPLARCPPSRSRSCPAGWGSTWPRSPPPPRPHRIWPACSPWPCSPPSPPAPSRSSPGPAGASRCACSWPWAWTPGPARAACSPPSPGRWPTSNATRPPPPSRRSPRPSTLRRIADQAAAHAEAAASKAPIDQQEERQAEAIARAAEAARPGRAAGAAVAGR